MAGGFLGRFWNILVGRFFSSTSREEFPTEALLPGQVTRVIFNRKQFKRAAPKASAFMPMQSEDGNLETSVCLTNGLANNEVWELAEREVAARRNQTLKARADVASAVIASQTLSIDHNAKPFARHANLVGWPTNKEEQKEIAQEIASQARLLEPDR